MSALVLHKYCSATKSDISETLTPFSVLIVGWISARQEPPRGFPESSLSSVLVGAISGGFKVNDATFPSLYV
jgi:hypothetical protein